METTVTYQGSALLQQTVNGPTVRQEGYARNWTSAQRNTKLKELVRDNFGLNVLPETIVPEGTALIPYGEEKLRKLKAETGKLPLVNVGLERAIEAYKVLDPIDVKAQLSAFHMTEDGLLHRIDPVTKQLGGGIGYNHTGLSQLVALHADKIGLPKNAVANLEWLSPKARSAAANDIFQRANGIVGDRVFRTILNTNGSTRYLRAVTSPQHVGVKGNTLALLSALQRAEGSLYPANARCRVNIMHDRTEVELFFPMYEREIRVGDVALGCQRITISETKDVSATVRNMLLRVLCLNFTTAYFGNEEGFSRRHVGNGFLREVAGAIVGGMDKLTPFIEAFGDSYENVLPDGQTRADVVQRAAKATKGILPAETWESAQVLWDADGIRGAGDTLAGFVNALTRASQSLRNEDADVAEDFAGRVVVEGWAAIGF